MGDRDQRAQEAISNLAGLLRHGRDRRQGLRRSADVPSRPISSIQLPGIRTQASPLRSQIRPSARPASRRRRRRSSRRRAGGAVAATVAVALAVAAAVAFPVAVAVAVIGDHDTVAVAFRVL